ncbi:MAG TPA: restriction endonuclease subunit S, partial [Elusimicrobiales bacterium]|nr:restriction endonuclease subunit S [Elusimicrobiales bacterium]
MSNQIGTLKMGQKLKKTPAGEIPVEWEVMPIPQIAEIVGGGTPERANPEYWGGEIFWATPTDVASISGPTISKTKERISKEGLRNSAANLMPKGSVLMTSRATLGYAVVNTVPMATNQGFINFRPSERLNSYFLMYYLRLKAVEMERLAGGSTFLEIPKSALKSFYVPAPLLSEQQRIVEILLGVDNLIANVSSEIEKTKELKKGLMRQLLTCGIGHRKFKKTEAGKIPESWSLVSFGEAFSFLRNGSNSREELSDSGDVGYIHYGDLHTKWQTKLDCSVVGLPKIKAARIGGLPFLKNGDLVMADASEDYAGVGVSVEVSNVGEQKIVAG